MKSKDLKQKTVPELKTLLFESREKLRQLRFDLAGAKLKDVKTIGNTKKDIARIMTIIKEELAK
ncbi:MAG: 50S ribosomal protein L29 [bacterium]